VVLGTPEGESGAVKGTAAGCVGPRRELSCDRLGSTEPPMRGDCSPWLSCWIPGILRSFLTGGLEADCCEVGLVWPAAAVLVTGEPPLFIENAIEAGVKG
jgi:hypothetical protein